MISQLLIFIFGCVSISLFTTKKYYRWGFVFGLAGEPFWIYATIVNKQLGMLLVSIWFTVFYIKGIIQTFFIGGNHEYPNC